MWTDILKSIVRDSLLILAVAWLAKAITTHRLAKDVENFKTALTIEGNRDNTVFSRLHERRIMIIAEVYTALVSAESAVGHYINKMGAPTPPEGQTQTDVALAAMWRLVDAADNHRICFTPETAATLDEVVAALRSSWNWSAIGQGRTNANDCAFEMVAKAYNLVKEKVPELLAAVR